MQVNITIYILPMKLTKLKNVNMERFNGILFTGKNGIKTVCLVYELNLILKYETHMYIGIAKC